MLGLSLQGGQFVRDVHDVVVDDLGLIGGIVMFFCCGLEILLALGNLTVELGGGQPVFLGHGRHVPNIFVGVGSVVGRGVIIIHCFISI